MRCVIAAVSVVKRGQTVTIEGDLNLNLNEDGCEHSGSPFFRATPTYYVSRRLVNIYSSLENEVFARERYRP